MVVVMMMMMMKIAGFAISCLKQAVTITLVYTYLNFVFQSFYAGRNSQSPVYSLQFDRTSLYVALANGVRSLDFSI